MNTTTLIITTYNRPDALNLVVRSAFNQSLLPDEIIIADDGSKEETRQLIAQLARISPVPLHHAWQEDKGFRLARSRNNALLKAQGDYIIFIDGDTILHRDFIADHVRLAEKNVFCTGSRLLLSQKETERIMQQQSFQFSFWHTDAPDKIKALRLPWVNVFSTPRNQPIEKWIYRIRNCNMAAWREDIFAVNGYNQDIEGWGNEDTELGARLFKKGASLKIIKLAALQYHLWHQEYDRASLPENDAILRHTLHSQSYQCQNGLTTIPAA